MKKYVLAAALMVVAAVPAHAEWTYDYYSADRVLGASVPKVPQCVLTGTGNDGSLFMLKISTMASEYGDMIHVQAPRGKIFRRRVNAAFVVDDNTTWKLPLTPHPDNAYLGYAWGKRSATITLLEEIGRGRWLSVTFETGLSLLFDLRGSAAAVMGFARCVAALEGRDVPPPRAPVPKPYAGSGDETSI
jgi:hypothetical protein